MSNFSRRDYYDSTLGTTKHYAFTDTNTNPRNVASIMRCLLTESGDNLTKRRAYNMYMTLNKLATSKPDQSTLVYQYAEIVKSIFKGFIDGYGKFNKPTEAEIVKICAESRFNIMRSLKTLTGAGNVNIVYKHFKSTMVFEEKISFYINNSNLVGTPAALEFDVKSTGVSFGSNTTLTVIIPMRYIETMITQSYGECQSEFNKANIKTDTMSEKLRDTVLARLTKFAGYDIYNSIVAALYKDFIFMNFAREVIIEAENVVRYKPEFGQPIKKVLDLGVPIATLSLGFHRIEELFKKEGITELNPNILLDMFELTDSEVERFVGAFVRTDDKRVSQSPRMYYLRNEYQDYVDEESRISASIAYMTRFNVAVLALMIMTKSSIKESSKSRYLMTVNSKVSSIKSYMTSSLVTNNKNGLLDELLHQISVVDLLGSDIIKLKKYVSGEYDADRMK